MSAVAGRVVPMHPPPGRVAPIYPSHPRGKSFASHTLSCDRYFQTTRGETVERREVKWGTLYVNYEPTDIPSE